MCVLVVAGAIVYANSFQGVFLFDDVHAILNNGRIRRFWPMGSLLRGDRPLVELTFALNYALGGLRTFGYHAVNLIVHLFAGLALFGVVRGTIEAATERRSDEATKSGSRTTSKESRDSSRRLTSQPLLPSTRDTSVAPHPSHLTPHSSHLPPGAAFGIAFAVALLWIVHPLQTQSVTYIVQRGESMMGMFCLLALYAFVRGADSDRSARWYLVAVLASAAAMACKASAVVLPIVVLLYDRCCLGRSFGVALKKRGWAHLGLFASWSVLFATGVMQQMLAPSTDRIAIGLGFKGVTPWAYLLTQSEIILHYLRLSMLPHPLCLDYAWPAAKGIGDVLVPASIVLGLLAATGWALLRYPRIGFAGAWFFLFLAPTSSVIPVRDLAVEHRMYLPLAAVLVLVVLSARSMVGWLVGLSSTATASRWIMQTSLLLAAVVGLGACTVRRNMDYQDDLSMWQDVAVKQPQNARAHVNIGVLLERRDDLKGAVEAYRRALTIDPEYGDAHFNMGVALVRLERYDEAERAFREALRITPDDPGARVNLGDLRNRERDFEGAIVEYREALKIVPTDAGLRAKVCTALRRLRRISEAYAECQEALRVGPDVAFAHESLAHVYLANGDMAAAIPEFQRTVELDPKNASAMSNWGTTLKMEGQVEEAVKVYLRGLELEPNSAYLHLQLADAYMMLERHNDALASFEMTLRLTPNDVDALVEYGRALRFVGRREDALAQFRRVLQIDASHAEAKRMVEELAVAP